MTGREVAPHQADRDDGPQDGDRGRLSKTAGGADRYNQLPWKTRMFLEGLHDDDVANLNDILQTWREKKTIKMLAYIGLADNVLLAGRISKWVLVTALALFTATAGIITAINTYMGLLHPVLGH